MRMSDWSSDVCSSDLRHVGAHEGEPLSGRHALGREVDGLIEAVAADDAQLLKHLEISYGDCGACGQSKGGRIRCDDEIAAQATLQPAFRDAAGVVPIDTIGRAHV